MCPLVTGNLRRCPGRAGHADSQLELWICRLSYAATYDEPRIHCWRCEFGADAPRVSRAVAIGGQALAATGQAESVGGGGGDRDGEAVPLGERRLGLVPARAEPGAVADQLARPRCRPTSRRRAPGAASRPAGRRWRHRPTAGPTVPKLLPRSPSPAAESSASQMACSTTSPSECPSRPGGSSGQSQSGDAHRSALDEPVYVGADADAQVHGPIMPDRDRRERTGGVVRPRRPLWARCGDDGERLTRDRTTARLALAGVLAGARGSHQPGDRVGAAARTGPGRSRSPRARSGTSRLVRWAIRLVHLVGSSRQAAAGRRAPSCSSSPTCAVRRPWLAGSPAWSPTSCSCALAGVGLASRCCG